MATRIGTYLFNPNFNSPEAGKTGDMLFGFVGLANSGDVIVFSGDPLSKLPSGSVLLTTQLYVPSSTSGLTASVGYQSTDGDVVTPNATNSTYFNNATAIATAGRYSALSANFPVMIPKDAWLNVTIGGATLPANSPATAVSLVLRCSFMYPGPPIANR